MLRKYAPNPLVAIIKRYISVVFCLGMLACQADASQPNGHPEEWDTRKTIVASVHGRPAKEYRGDKHREIAIFGDTLGRKLAEIHGFLETRRVGLPFTPDPRAIMPYSEYVRLNVDTQALAYINLYSLTHKRLFLDEARIRLYYIAALGDSAFRGSGFDGQIGYSFLKYYELSHDPQMLAGGLRVAERCLMYSDNVMNWGYMAALCF